MARRFTIDLRRFPLLPRIGLCGALGLTAALGGCQAPGFEGGPVAALGRTEPPPPAGDEARLRTYATQMAQKYGSHPDDRAVALNYATALRRLDQHAQAVAVLQRLAVRYPHDYGVLAAYGKALADAGRLQEAATVLEHSHTPERPNWTVLSAQGSVADQMGDHARAQAYYAAALNIIPNQPQVLSNLGLSYALERKLPQAESTLRTAVLQPAADMRVRQNLALVLSLEHKYAEAQQVVGRDMPAIDAAETVSNLKQMIAESDVWTPTTGRSAATRRADRLQTATIDAQ